MDFSKLLFLVLFAFKARSSQSFTSIRIKADVLVLGAGIAGISAAKTLAEHNITNFIILEAENRIGGRAKSTILNSTNTRVELGANWIQGIDPNNPMKHPLWKIVSSCGGLGGQFVKDSNNGTFHVFDEKGNNISSSATFRKRFSLWNKILDPGLANYSVQRTIAKLPDISTRQALSDLGWFPSSPMDNLIEWVGFDLDEAAMAPEYISLYNSFPDPTYSDFGDPNSTENYFVTDQKVGFEKVVQCLSKDFLEDNDRRLILKSVIYEINMADPDFICVKTREAGIKKEYCAPHAISTVSLGVLQSKAIQFIPPLPLWKQHAISSCIFGIYLKVFLEFDTIFWKDDAVVDFFLHIDKVRGCFCQFQPVFKSRPILFVTVTDKIAKSVYNQTVQETTSQIMKVLRLIYGEKIPNPLKVTIPDWWINPLYHGTYSSTSRFCNYVNIAQRVARLHFAGEATSTKYNGYLHGGYFSGIRAAKEVIASRLWS